ncbi:general substrate transporter [Fusarium sp. MPI-SDFR-AT-0072]|nr:general substrate transporter [Fusarium sp. MPI-SDFR-AT-0072]
MGTSYNSFLNLRGRALRQAQIGLIAAPAFILFGYNQAGVGPLATLQSFVHIFPDVDTVNTTGSLKSHDSTSKGAVIASFQIGALMGSLSCLFLGDQLGRRKTIFLAAILTIIGQILQVAAYHLVQFVVGRIILGIGIGEISVVVPIWLSECSPASHRGRDVVAAGIFMCLGYALCNWIDYGFSNLPASTLQWRLPLAVSMPLSCLILGVIMFMPESPRWLVHVNQTEKATATLMALKNCSEIDEAISLEIAQIESSLENARQERTSLMNVFSKNEEKLGYRFCLCIFLQFVHLGTSLAKILAACALTWKFLSCFISYVTIDRWGRRAVFMISGAGMSICMTSLAICTSFPSSSHSASIASAFFIFLFNSFYPIGFLGANFLYCSEVAPVRLRVAMNSVSTANHWLWNFVVTMVTPVAIENIGYRYYIMYAIISALIPIVVFFFYPETMNRNLEALNNTFVEASTVFEVVSMARKMPTQEIEDSSFNGSAQDGKKNLEEKEYA